jgi:hypothetical protein
MRIYLIGFLHYVALVAHMREWQVGIVDVEFMLKFAAALAHKALYNPLDIAFFNGTHFLIAFL